MEKKKPMSESERTELMKKMDDDLDKFIEEMAAKKQSENIKRKPFDFDEFCRELDEHPAFMKELKSGENGQYSETIQALQAMKYDEDDEEDKQSTAENHKKEGNKHFQYKKYRWAIDCYTNGIKAKCADSKLNAVLFLNRAAAHKHLGNNRSAINDCIVGRRFDPTNLKGVVRCAECLLALHYPSDALRWIESSRILFEKALQGAEPTEEQQKQLEMIKELKRTAEKDKETEDRDKRKAKAVAAKELAETKKLLDALKERKVNLCPRVPFDRPDLYERSLLEVVMPQLKTHQHVCLNEAGNLEWPLLVQYPETGQTDVLTECDETVMVGTLLGEVLATPAEWDTEHKFTLDKVSFFVSDEWDEYVTEVYPWMEFRQVFSIPRYRITQGLPVLMVYTQEKVSESFTNIGDNKFVIK